MDKSTLWPPNNKIETIQVSIETSDDCSDVDYVLTSITSNEDISNDVQNASIGESDLTFDLRASRKGKGNGRVYTITYTATDEAGNTATAQATVTVPHDQRRISFDDFENESDFYIYPNPAENYLIIEGSLTEKDDIEITLYDVLGQNLMNIKKTRTQTFNEKMDIERLNSGIYFIEIKHSKGVIIKKVIKQ